MNFADFKTAQTYLVVAVWVFIGSLVAGGLMWAVIDSFPWVSP